MDQAAHLGDGSFVDALANPAVMPLDDESRRVAYARNAVTALLPA